MYVKCRPNLKKKLSYKFNKLKPTTGPKLVGNTDRLILYYKIYKIIKKNIY